MPAAEGTGVAGGQLVRAGGVLAWCRADSHWLSSFTFWWGGGGGGQRWVGTREAPPAPPRRRSHLALEVVVCGAPARPASPPASRRAAEGARQRAPQLGCATRDGGAHLGERTLTAGRARARGQGDRAWGQLSCGCVTWRCVPAWGQSTLCI